MKRIVIESVEIDNSDDNRGFPTKTNWYTVRFKSFILHIFWEFMSLGRYSNLFLDKKEAIKCAKLLEQRRWKYTSSKRRVY